MSADSIILAFFTISIIWGGLAFFLSRAISKESKKKSTE
ncbi:MAG: MetS family NSS transporter small subunit [Bacteroidetes bacterium]|nr:MetS family NSS transporter small subunit [Bacteroidota bacterium]MBU2585934.1 MetS family NSS transporter small subunit [Bacteroidota bacterium]